MFLSLKGLPPGLQAWFTRFNRSASSTIVEQPLLDAKAIMRLFHRAREYAPLPVSQQEVAHRLLGDQRSPYRGAGLDFEENRPYQAGDERRFMNWRATARTGELTMKVYREERRPGIFILIDRRCAMRFGTRRRLKITQAVRAAALLAFHAQHQNIPVSGVVLEDRPDWHAQSNDPQMAFNLINTAARACPPCLHATDAPSLAGILKRLQAMLTPGTRLYLVSDFHDIVESSRPLLLNLAQEHDVTAIHIVDVAEQQLPAAGLLDLYGTDRQQSLRLNSSEPALRARFEKQATDRLNRRQQLFTSLGLRYLHLQSDEEAIEPVVLPV